MGWKVFKDNIGVIGTKIGGAIHRQKLAAMNKAAEVRRVRDIERAAYKQAYHEAKLKALTRRASKEGSLAGAKGPTSAFSGIGNYFHGVAENSKRQDMFRPSAEFRGKR
jgi:hypothetical protein